MSKTELIEDDNDRAQYCCIPSAVNCFEGMGALYIVISQWIKKRKARKQELIKNVEEIALIEEKVETIKAKSFFYSFLSKIITSHLLNR